MCSPGAPGVPGHGARCHGAGEPTCNDIQGSANTKEELKPLKSTILPFKALEPNRKLLLPLKSKCYLIHWNHKHRYHRYLSTVLLSKVVMNQTPEIGQPGPGTRALAPRCAGSWCHQTLEPRPSLRLWQASARGTIARSHHCAALLYDESDPVIGQLFLMRPSRVSRGREGCGRSRRTCSRGRRRRCSPGSRTDRRGSRCTCSHPSPGPAPPTWGPSPRSARRSSSPAEEGWWACWWAGAGCRPPGRYLL